MVINIKYALNKNIHILKHLLNSLADLMADLPFGKEVYSALPGIKKEEIV